MELANDKTINRKIGLMYGSEFGYAANPSYWSTSLINYKTIGNNWMLLTTQNTYTMTRRIEYTQYVLVVSNNGLIFDQKDAADISNAIFPTFSLKTDSTILQGNGTNSNPYIVSL